MTGARLTTGLARENDMGGRFTNPASGDSRAAFRPSACAVESCGLTARPPVAGRAAEVVAGATPQSGGLVRARGQVCFHTPAPAPWVAPATTIPPGRVFDR